MKLALAMSSGSTDSIDVSETLFNRDFNEALVHQVVTALQAGNRAGTKAQKNRSDVRGGGAKPWRQKGTGRARAGTIRSPIWRGGGRTFAATPRNFEQKINRKMYQGAMRSILSELVRQNRVRIVDTFEVTEPKTKFLVEKLKKMDLEATLIVLPVIEDNLYLAQRNLSKVSITTSQQLTPLKLLQHEHIILSVDALRKLEENLV